MNSTDELFEEFEVLWKQFNDNHKLFKEKNMLEDGSIVTTEELVFDIPQKIIDELDWEDGTVLEWERDDVGKVVLRNIDGLALCEENEKQEFDYTG